MPYSSPIPYTNNLRLKAFNKLGRDGTAVKVYK